MPAPKRSEAPARTRINRPAPSLDGGRYPPKRCVGDTVTVSADIFRDGHEIMRAVVRYKAPGGRRWLEAPMHPVDAHINGVRWEGQFTVETPGSWQFSIEAWNDVFATWRDELHRKIDAGQHDLAGELSEGVVLLEGAARATKDAVDRENDIGVPMWDPATGGGYDGLTLHGPNLNQGAESTLAFISTMQHARQRL